MYTKSENQLKKSPIDAVSQFRFWFFKFNSKFALLSVFSVIVVLILWYLSTTIFNLVDPFVLPSPWTILTEMQILVTEGYTSVPLSTHIGVSLIRTLTGLGLGIAIGIPVGLLIGYSRVVSAIISPFISFLRPIPPIAFIPLMILYFGIGEFPKIALIFLSAFWYIVLNTSSGVKSVPDDLLRAGRNLGLSGFQLFAHVILPAAMPQIVTGIKSATALSWAIVVAAEMIAAQSGLGYMIMDAATFFRLVDVYIGIALIGIIGVILEGITTLFENKLLHWRGK
jgi:ABC-type nitrate/sulfonate/bicarbonate transport system permease component